MPQYPAPPSLALLEITREKKKMKKTKVRSFNLLEWFCESVFLSLPGTGQREGGTFRDANEQIE